MEDFKKITKSLEDSGLIIKQVSETPENEEKDKKRWTYLYLIKYIKS